MDADDRQRQGEDPVAASISVADGLLSSSNRLRCTVSVRGWHYEDVHMGVHFGSGDQDFDMFLQQDEDKEAPSQSSIPETKPPTFDELPHVWTGKVCQPSSVKNSPLLTAGIDKHASGFGCPTGSDAKCSSSGWPIPRRKFTSMEDTLPCRPSPYCWESTHRQVS